MRPLSLIVPPVNVCQCDRKLQSVSLSYSEEVITLPHEAAHAMTCMERSVTVDLAEKNCRHWTPAELISQHAVHSCRSLMEKKRLF